MFQLRGDDGLAEIPSGLHGGGAQLTSAAMGLLLTGRWLLPCGVVLAMSNGGEAGAGKRQSRGGDKARGRTARRGSGGGGALRRRRRA